MKNKIVFVIPNMTGGGTERVISLLANEYVNMGYQVAIMQFAGYEKAYELNEKIENFSIAPQSKGNPLIWFKRILDMRKYFKQNEGCYIFAFCVKNEFYEKICCQSAFRSYDPDCHVVGFMRKRPRKTDHRPRNSGYGGGKSGYLTR